LGTPDLTEFRTLIERFRKSRSEKIHNERFAASRLSMMRIMARRMNATMVVALAFEVARANLRLRLIHANVLSTIQRFGRTSNPAASDR
jgi:hypothetical protein